ncbi:multiple epidermal growth factor-like domains protein 10 [Saccostrea echinata]|uniref:multiple epidermal growth factor-like domains protein 10 n=1 Tax=Saccostrea echinata TaxID=191078 RepID=UPI002A804B19|nr:multiple epidermal growth factor-like domains protein 10 [Saccostrea echinata]
MRHEDNQKSLGTIELGSRANADLKKHHEYNGYTTRFLGFSVYISNTTDRNDGKLCFHDINYTKYTIPDHVNIICPTHGQYVIYYNERLQGVNYPDDYFPYAFVELCEIEVYGCPIPGYYGSNCSLPCPDSNCIYCHIQSGVCEGCKPGYKGHQCEQQCNQKFYGELCNEKCGNCTDGWTCNHVNGTCTNGCDVGVYGDKCKIVCPSGWYGNNCLEKCYNCETCDRFTGQCTSPCKTGWKGIFYMEECDGRRYGQDCEEECGACLGYKQCHHINGSCLEGCDFGYKWDLCKSACLDGTYGTNCEQKCNKNCGVPYRCNGTTGQCEGGCQFGWEGPHCKTKCTNNMYGRNCSRRCGNCRNGAQCHHLDGTCQSGCMQGYKDRYCTSECKAGFYGFNCTEECSLFCKTPRDCNHITGHCKQGCTGGWQGDMCLQVANRVGVVEWQSEFHGFLAAFCISVTINVVLVAYIIINRRQTKNRQKKQKCQDESEMKAKKFDQDIVSPKAYEDESNKYQELGELALPSDYGRL